MCGIAGYTTFSRPPADEAALKTMGDAIVHRGPDASGIYRDDRIGLVHRRLAIIDLSEAGTQPMRSACGRYVIAFNGEIYNFLELRTELAEAGYTFTTYTDTEVILALYARDGVACVDQLNGMFAMAVWDTQEHTLFLARDRLGKKPLYYYPKDGNLHFASELKSLLAIDAFPRVIREDAVYDFFAYQYVPDPKTIFEGVFKLPAAHCLLLKEGRMRIWPYWDVVFSPDQDKPEEAFEAELLEQLSRCVENRMVSDVPLGAFLSGGVDSSGVVALMSRVAARQGGERVTTCTIGFDDEKLNETEFARIVAEQYQTNHHEMTVHANVRDHLEKITAYFDEPFADPSLVPTFFVSRLAREKVTVAIAGDGGDEVFAGYEKYAADLRENQWRSKVPGWIRDQVFPRLTRLLSFSNHRLSRRARSLLTTLSVDPATGFYLSNSFIKDDEWDCLARDELKQRLRYYHPSELTIERYHQCRGDHLSRILYTDIKTWLVGGILVKVDRMSMANSLEVRAPILDYTVVELGAKMPSSLKLRVNPDGKPEKKYLLKKVFEPLLPREILYRKKMGFDVPLANWLRDELKALAEERLFNRSTGLTQYFKPEAIRKFWDEHQQNKADHASLLWSLLMFQMWWDHYMSSGETA